MFYAQSTIMVISGRDILLSRSKENKKMRTEDSVKWNQAYTYSEDKGRAGVQGIVPQFFFTTVSCCGHYNYCISE